MTKSIVLIFGLLSFFLKVHCLAQKQTIMLHPAKDKVIIFFATQNAGIRFPFTDFIRALEKTKQTAWYKSLDDGDHQKLDETIVSLLDYYRTVKQPILNGKPASAIKFINNDLWLVGLLQANVATLLLMDGKASVNRIGLGGGQSEIKVKVPKQTDGGSYSFFFADGSDLFFKGQLHTAMDSSAMLVPVVIPVWKEDSVIRKSPSPEELIAAQYDTLVYTVVEQQPEYPGGLDGFQKNVLRKVPSYVRSKFQGQRFFVQFIVEKDGTLSHADVIHPSKTDTETKEVLSRAVLSSGNWTPGRQNGTAIRVRFVFPIKMD